MRAAVIAFPGSNCDRDARVALRTATGTEPATVWHRDRELPPVDLVVLPGGFSHGDYLRPGAVAARSPVMRTVAEAAARGVRILGICNGFQILTECGLLPGILLRNAGLRFVCRSTGIRVATSDSPFTRNYRAGAVLRMPVAHHDGNYFADAGTLARLEQEDRVAFRYLDNPNGSAADIAGILNATRNVLGMMPHPERAADALLGGTDGAPLLAALAA